MATEQTNEPTTIAIERVCCDCSRIMGLGEIAYTTYCSAVGGVSVKGDKLPTYKDQAPKIMEAWNLAAQSVAAEVILEVQTMIEQYRNAITKYGSVNE
jgi:hypothetical protein